MKNLNFSLLTVSIVFITIFSCKNDNTQPTTETTIAQDNKLEVVEETVEINGVNHYIKKIGSGEPIIVLHGGPGLFHDYLTPHFESLSKNYQIIFYDQRGCGRTEFPKDTTTITADNFIADLEAIRAHLNIEKMNLLGHSWGATLAINYGKKYSKHLNKLILVSPAPSSSEYFDQMFRNMQAKRSDEDTKELVKLMSSKEFEKRDPATFVKAIALGDKVNLVNQESINDLYKPMNFTDASANNLLLVNSIMEKHFFEYDITEGIEAITSPTIIIVGDMDNVPFASTQLLQESLNARIEVLKPACYYPFFEASKDFTFAVKNFISPEYE